MSSHLSPEPIPGVQVDLNLSFHLGRKYAAAQKAEASNTKLVPLLQSLLNSRHPLRYMLRVSELPCLALAWMAAPHGYCIPLVLETKDPP